MPGFARSPRQKLGVWLPRRGSGAGRRAEERRSAACGCQRHACEGAAGGRSMVSIGTSWAQRAKSIVIRKCRWAQELLQMFFSSKSCVIRNSCCGKEMTLMTILWGSARAKCANGGRMRAQVVTRSRSRRFAVVLAGRWLAGASPFSSRTESESPSACWPKGSFLQTAGATGWYPPISAVLTVRLFRPRHCRGSTQSSR